MHEMNDMDLALARAVICRTLQWGFQVPDARTRQAFFCGESAHVRREAAAALDETEDGALRESAAAMGRLDEVSLEDLAARHQSLFGHTLRGKVCAYETEYGGSALFQQGQELSDISGYYLAFGLQPSQATGERLDHIACEFEFLQFLALKEAYALEKGDTEMLEVTRAAWRSFLRDHVGRFGRALGAGLLREDSTGFYGALGRFCMRFLEAESRRLSLPVGPEFLELRPEDDGVPMACGQSSESQDLLQIGTRR